MKDKLDIAKEIIDLKAFNIALTKTNTELLKTIKAQEEEITHLKALVEGTVPLIKTESDAKKFETNDQEYICRTEISKLRDFSLTRALTLEEAKRFDIYCKILKDITKTENLADLGKDIPQAELLRLATGEDDV
jgi:hypothetical protein